MEQVQKNSLKSGLFSSPRPLNIATFLAQTVNYAGWEDDTGEVVGVLDNGKNLVKLQVDKYYSFDNADSQNKFTKFKEDFVEKYKKKDEYIDDVTIFEIPGHMPHVMVHSKGYQEPSCLSVNWFWVSSFFLMSWPYRFWFELIADTKKITIRKTIYTKKRDEAVL